LDYVAPEMQGEIPITVIELGDIESEIKYWKTIVVCYVLEAHPPFDMVNGYVQRIWSKYRINKVSMLKNGIMFVRFDTAEAKNEVLQGEFIISITNLSL